MFQKIEIKTPEETISFHLGLVWAHIPHALAYFEVVFMFLEVASVSFNTILHP